MLKNASLEILVINKEDAASVCFNNADIICNNTIDALELLLNPLRIIATLRR